MLNIIKALILYSLPTAKQHASLGYFVYKAGVQALGYLYLLGLAWLLTAEQQFFFTAALDK